MTLDRQTVLVSGAAGFTGMHLIPALRQRGYDVVGLVQHATDAPNQIVCDLLNPDQVTDVIQQVCPTHVIHLAALSFVEAAHRQNFYRVNVFGTQHLLEALTKLKKPPTKIILASSANIYGNPPTVCIDESVCPDPINHYAISKLAMEQIAKTWFGSLPIIITRPFNYTGSQQRTQFLIPKIVHHFAQRAHTITLGNTHIERDFSDVQFIVESYCRLLASSAHSQIVNVCSGRSHSIIQILQMMAKIAGYEINVTQDPRLIRAHDLIKLVGSNAKLFELVGEIPVNPFEQTLQRMFDDAQAQFA